MRARALISSLALLAAAPWPAQAHEGHGLPGVSHWHAGDAWPWLVAAAVVIALIVIARGKP